MPWTLVLTLFFALSSPAPQAVDCLVCHGDKGLQDPAGHSVYVDEKIKNASVHGSLACTDCHAAIKSYPHPDQPQPVQCGNCHAEEHGGVVESVHARVVAQPCLGCHGDPHGILPSSDPKSTVYPLNVPRTCGACHGNPDLAKRYGLSNVYSLYMDSIHGFALTKDGLLVAATCSSCHGTHKILSHGNPLSRSHRNNVPSTCGSCHAGPKAEYFAGVHGKALAAGRPGAPVCIDCHMAHRISIVREASWQLRSAATCGNCHKERLATYRDTFHAQVSALGFVDAAHCWNCHGYHEILPASDPKSSVARINLQTTCGQCHTGATKSFVSYKPHANPHDQASDPILYYTARFMNLLMISVLGFFAAHTLLWFIRSVFDRGRDSASAGTKVPG